MTIQRASMPASRRQADLRREHLGHAAAAGRRVDVPDHAAAQRPGGRVDPHPPAVERLLVDDVAEALERLDRDPDLRRARAGGGGHGA